VLLTNSTAGSNIQTVALDGKETHSVKTTVSTNQTGFLVGSKQLDRVAFLVGGQPSAILSGEGQDVAEVPLGESGDWVISDDRPCFVDFEYPSGGAGTSVRLTCQSAGAYKEAWLKAMPLDVERFIGVYQNAGDIGLISLRPEHVLPQASIDPLSHWQNQTTWLVEWWRASKTGSIVRESGVSIPAPHGSYVGTVGTPDEAYLLDDDSSGESRWLARVNRGAGSSSTTEVGVNPCDGLRYLRLSPDRSRLLVVCMGERAVTYSAILLTRVHGP
jgi:hypothetical protein